MKCLYKQNAVDTIHKIDGFRKTKIVHQNDIDCPSPSHDENKSHDPDERGHDHGNDGQVREKIAPWKFITEQKIGDGNTKDRSGNDGGHTEKKGIDQGFEIEGIGKKIIEIPQSEDSLIGCKGIVK